MTLIKIAKNNTDSDILLINQTIPARGQLEFESNWWQKLIQNKQIYALIESGSVIMNDGTSDLTAANGIKLVNTFQEIEFNQNFSFRKIKTGFVVTVPVEQQMLSYQEIQIELGGELNNEGEVLIIR